MLTHFGSPPRSTCVPGHIRWFAVAFCTRFFAVYADVVRSAVLTRTRFDTAWFFWTHAVWFCGTHGWFTRVHGSTFNIRTYTALLHLVRYSSVAFSRFLPTHLPVTTRLVYAWLRTCGLPCVGHTLHRATVVATRLRTLPVTPRRLRFRTVPVTRLRLLHHRSAFAAARCRLVAVAHTHGPACCLRTRSHRLRTLRLRLPRLRILRTFGLRFPVHARLHTFGYLHGWLRVLHVAFTPAVAFTFAAVTRFHSLLPRLHTRTRFVALRLPRAYMRSLHDYST